MLRVAILACLIMAFQPKDAQPKENEAGVMVTRGDATFGVVAVKICSTIMQLKTAPYRAEQSEVYCFVALRIRNMSDGKKLDYQTWAGTAKLTDDLGNSYRLKRIPNGHMIYDPIFSGLFDPVSEETIYSDKPCFDMLMFERPVPKAKDLILRLPMKNLGGDDEEV